ncbi:MAG: hypothetical protein KKC46_01945 [Proteobacteria bacterium]|nr:hypothetical protein [Pseudomonadota bacterium]
MFIDTKGLYLIYKSQSTKISKLTVKKDGKVSSINFYIDEPTQDINKTIEPIPIDNVYKMLYKTDTGEYRQKVNDASWTEAWLFEPYNKNSKKINKTHNLIFVIFAYFQQYAIIIIAFCALFHIWAHLLYFVLFKKLPVSKRLKLTIRLDPYSALHEFGLERWNQALNMIYWALCPALVIPIISKSAQSDINIYDIGQLMIRWLVPLLFLSPMLFTLIARQTKAMELWDTVRNEKNEENIERYHKQLLWPLDKNWASKLGIIISFILLSYLIGDILKELGADKLVKL